MEVSATTAGDGFFFFFEFFLKNLTHTPAVKEDSSLFVAYCPEKKNNVFEKKIATSAPSSVLTSMPTSVPTPPADMCLQLRYYAECESCSEDSGEGVVTRVANGEPCLITQTNKCQEGECVNDEAVIDETPSSVPTSMPTSAPSSVPTSMPTSAPSSVPTSMPTSAPSSVPTSMPTSAPSPVPTSIPTSAPTPVPTKAEATSATVSTEPPAGFLFLFYFCFLGFVWAMMRPFLSVTKKRGEREREHPEVMVFFRAEKALWAIIFG